jgi:hypothetical protein
MARARLWTPAFAGVTIKWSIMFRRKPRTVHRWHRWRLWEFFTESGAVGEHRFLCHENRLSMKTRSIFESISRFIARVSRSSHGKVSTHWREFTTSRTLSTRYAAVSPIRRAQQDGQIRPLQENATRRSKPQAGHLSRAKPCQDAAGEIAAELALYKCGAAGPGRALLPGRIKECFKVTRNHTIQRGPFRLMPVVGPRQRRFGPARFPLEYNWRQQNATRAGFQSFLHGAPAIQRRCQTDFPS